VRGWALEKRKLVCVKWEGLDYLYHEVKKEKRKNNVVLIRKGTISRTKNKYSA